MANTILMLEILQQVLMHPIPLFFTTLVIFIAIRFLFTESKKNLPPSPTKLPVLGNLLQLGTSPHRSLHSMARAHGPLMFLHLGNVPTLVVSSPEMAQEIMKTHDLIFANRPDSRINRRLLYDYKDLSLAPYGEYWRQMRSICVVHLLNMKRVLSFRSVREEETTAVVKKIAKSLGPVDLNEIFAALTSDVVCRVVFGKKYNKGEGGSRFRKLLKEFGALLGTVNIEDFIPWLGWLNKFNGLNDRVEKVFHELDQFLDEAVEDHIAQGSVDLSDDQMDFVDVLLQIQRTNADFHRDSIKAMILDMFAAGADTIYTALEWMMTEILKHPNVMSKAQREIRAIKDAKSNINEDDIDKLPYLKAIIKESLRLHPPIPLLVPRESAEEVKIKGHDIPSKTRVIINAWAIGRDPNVWEEPEVFRPERFLDSKVDYNGHDFQLIPFGAGRRGCPGTTFAIAIIEIALASLLHKFDWSLPGGAKLVDLDVTEASGLAVHRKTPLVVVATPRSS